jgi:N-acetylglucosamine-6-phosphate deacetylase
MNGGEISARHYATRELIYLRWQDGRITSLETATQSAATNLWVAPALMDVQVNGFGGFDFQQDDLQLADLLSAARQLQGAGCATFLLTLITDEWEKLMNRLRHLRKLRAQSPELQAAIAGWHIEGPFLSAEPGFCGAHNLAVMFDPTPQHIRELRKITESDPLLLTLAPERRGAIAAIELATSLGIKVSLGHTNASAEILRAAVAAGATGFTHLANACPRELDRHDNIIWRVCDTPGLTVSLIADGIHVSPSLFRLLHRSLDPASIFYTTDAMAAAGAGPGRYTIGHLQVEVGADQIVRQPGKTNFAGSALRPITGVVRTARMLNCAWQETWTRFSDRPAKFVGLHNDLAIGQPANFCLVKAIDENVIESVEVFVRGEPQPPISGRTLEP